MHELGHALGLPEGGGAGSIMSGASDTPAASDFAAVGTRAPGASCSAGVYYWPDGYDGYPTNEIEGWAARKGSWHDIPLRRGFYDSKWDEGFGYDKARHTHNLSNKDVILGVIEHATHAEPSHNENAGYVQYSWNIVKTECSSRKGKCETVDKINVIVVVDEDSRETFKTDHYNVPVKGVTGVITAYCEGMTRCPDWVNDAGRGP